MNLSLLGHHSYDPLFYHSLEWWKVKKGNMMRDGRKTLLLLMTRNCLFKEVPVFCKCGSSQKGFLLTSGIWELRNGCEALVSNHSWKVLRLTVEKKVRELVCNILMKVKKEQKKESKERRRKNEKLNDGEQRKRRENVKEGSNLGYPLGHPGQSHLTLWFGLRLSLSIP